MSLNDMLLNLDPQIQERLQLSIAEVMQFCQRWQITELALFGSVLNNRFGPDSDIDVIIHFASEARQGLLTLAKIKHELEAKTGRKVDIALKESVENSENWIRRNEILKTARVIYEQN